MKLPDVEVSELDKREWWLVGRYLADGHVGTRGDYFISIGNEKTEIFEKKASGFYGSYTQRDGCRQYRLLPSGMRDNVKEMLAKCGRGAANKQVPIEGICLNKAYAKELLDGYLSGDGNKTGNATSATSVSRELLLGMAMVAQRATENVISIFGGKEAGTHSIGDRTVKQRKNWVMAWRDGCHKENRILEDGAWKKVKEVIPMGVKRVYSIQVADDASYTAEGCIVKNCPLQLDIVERIINRYSNEGDLVYDPFGGISTVPMTAVKMKRRGYMCELNADYFRDAVGYLEAAEREVDTPTLFDYFGIS